PRIHGPDRPWIRGNGRPSTIPLTVEEAGRGPDALVQVALHRSDVGVRVGGVPTAREPGADATPQVAGDVVLAALDGVEPGVLTLVARAPHGVRVVEVVRRRVQRGGEGDLVVRVADLQQADGLRALPGCAVDTDAVAGSAGAGVGAVVTHRRHRPPGLLGG